MFNNINFTDKLKNFLFGPGITAFIISVIFVSGAFGEDGGNLKFKAEVKNNETPRLIYFYSPSCHRCAAAMEDVMPLVEEHFGNRIKVDYLDISESANYIKLFTLKQRLGADDKSVFPVIYFAGRFMDGRNEDDLTFEDIATFVARGMGAKDKTLNDHAKIQDVIKYFKNLGPLAIAAAGLVDGINPCAFTVIVFFMSFLFFQGYRKRTIAIVGISFITSVFITYLLLGLGFFGWLHAIKGYWVIAKVLNIGIGIFSIILGLLSVYDAFIYKKKGDGEGMILHLPKGIKDKIHKVIGMEYRVNKDKPLQKGIIALAVSAFGVGFVISLFESVCTGQLYLPTIIFVLKTTPHKIMAFTYLALYNLMFIIPLVLIYLFALAGVSSNSFADIMKKNMFLIKMLMAGMFLILGVSLVNAEGVSVASGGTSPAGNVSKAQASPDPNFFDFGTVKECEVLKHKFILKNNESEPIRIKEVNTSCACAASKHDKEEIAPGDQAEFEITFDTKGYPGLRKRQLFVHTTSRKNPLVIFEIQAMVK